MYALSLLGVSLGWSLLLLGFIFFASSTLLSLGLFCRSTKKFTVALALCLMMYWLGVCGPAAVDRYRLVLLNY
jgi:hypothetical protein